jgi:hypothetical protein
MVNGSILHLGIMVNGNTLHLERMENGARSTCVLKIYLNINMTLMTLNPVIWYVISK